MLSKDILTQFRVRSDEVRMLPLSFSEYYSVVSGDKHDAYDDYALYGGMPLIISRPSAKTKTEYLDRLFDEVYLKNIIERKAIVYPEVLY